MEELSLSLNLVALERFTRHPYVQSRHRDVSLFPDGNADLHRSARIGFSNEIRGLLGVGVDATRPDNQGRTALTIARLNRRTETAHYIACGHDELVHVLMQCLGRTPTLMEIYGAATLPKLRGFRCQVRKYVEEKTSKLLKAARTGDRATVSTILESGEIGVNVMEKMTGETAWSVAVAHGDLGLCVYLVKNGARIDGAYRIDGECHSMLVAAVLTGNSALVRWLVSLEIPSTASADIDTISTCALTEAVRMGSVEMVELLLDLGVRFDPWRSGFKLPEPFTSLLQRINLSALSESNTNPDLWFVLCAACWFQDRRMFKHLLDKFPDFQDLSCHAQNASVVLFLAVYRENKAFVLELLKRGTSVNGRWRFHALLAAVLTDSRRMLEFLLARGGDVNALSFNTVKYTNQDNSLLEVALFFYARECALLLVPMETRPHHLERALTRSVERNDVELATLLLDRVVQPSADTVQSFVYAAKTPLMLDLLLSRFCGDDIPVVTFNRMLATFCQYNGSRTDLLDVLLAHGVDISYNTAENPNQTSALMEGLLIGRNVPNAAMLEFVLANGMPPVTTNCLGKTPLQYLNGLSQRRYAQTALKQQTFEACRAVLTAETGNSSPLGS